MQMQVTLRNINKLITTSTPFAADRHDGEVAPDAERIIRQIRRGFEISLLDEIRVAPARALGREVIEDTEVEGDGVGVLRLSAVGVTRHGPAVASDGEIGGGFDAVAVLQDLLGVRVSVYLEHG
ncbi:hypothetical protein BRADI_4g23822v3 [Brachypodium distachyon]|uniref:Uncharacterized protein n=1 Tax=Brachypodium distachyon TaxID=15368 RepID=A0A2K2CPS6_BRADI|nr:hypothetical protein BRADI_4g23822v3 [Brachypodium distachyon]